MAGRIRTEDVALVRERARIDEVVGEYVALRASGGSSLSGLCPFHDEKSPSFNVTPSRGLFYCFGCSEGGDVIKFLQKIDNLSFAEAVERLAGKFGVQLRYEEGGSGAGRERAPKTRYLEANRAAQQFYAAQLATSAEAEAGRHFLSERGFDQAAAETFGIGYAPKGWDSLNRHLRGLGYGDAELLAGGLLSQKTGGGSYDRFRGRLVWPIHSPSGDVIGFGARKLYDDDTGPKYLNTPETPVYRKSEVLFGLDLARREIGRLQQAVVVEGYTDVMACHLSGVGTAVATCGTSFGEDHVRVLRRLLMDRNELRGEVVFTFDGDSAGQKAAVRAFTEDRNFVTQTFVAVQPDGLDPSELWQAKGPEAVRALVAARVPLSEFVVKSVLADYDLTNPEGRVAALRAAAPVVARTKDASLRPEYARSLAGWLGMEVEPVMTAVAAAARSGSRAPAQQGSGPATAGEAIIVADRPRPGERALLVDREALKTALQYPALTGDAFDELPGAAFGHPAYVAVRAAIEAAGGTAIGAKESGELWVARVLEAAANDAVRSVVTELAVEPLRLAGEPDARYVDEQVSHLHERMVQSRVAEVRSQLQRIDPEADEYQQVFGELIELEQQRRRLRERAAGGA
ncbi:MAG: DNA primase [Actinomycetes bacterium]